MKKLFFTLFVLLPAFVFAQIDYDYEITVIDSFTCNATNQAGMFGLRAVEHNGNIHMSYFMQTATSLMDLIYSVRTEAGFTIDTVASIPWTHWTLINSKTTLQFDDLGNPHIYAAFPSEKEIFAYEKVDNEWQGTYVAKLGYWPYFAADPDGSQELGFVFWAPTSGYFSGQIVYASFNGDNWEFESLSSVLKLERTKPSIVNYNNKTYVAYGEGHYPDTLITRIYVKENNEWTLDYEDVNLTTYGGGGIDGLRTTLGVSAEGVYLLYNLRRTAGVNPQHLHHTYLINEGQGWQNQIIDYDGSLTAAISSPNLILNDESTAFWISESNGFNPNLSWIKNNGKGGIIGLPHFYYDIWLQDFVIKDNNAYIYYWEGSARYPYNTPVTFKEININLNQLFTSVEASYHYTNNEEICDRDSLLWHSSYYLQSGTYYDSLQTVSGCDSIYELNLTVNSSYHYTNNEEICDRDSLLWHSSYYLQSGTYYDSLQTISGCDSIYELSLSVMQNPSPFTISGKDTVVLDQTEVYTVPDSSNLTYSWNVQNGTIIDTLSNYEFSIQWDNLGTGYIYVVATNQHGCTSDTAKLEVYVG
ncbi:MAG: hypothetical protein HQ543_05215, partial [Bacteroidetes bacterium]|nr:hypothetical protein [Bacteroidota bacterium]